MSINLSLSHILDLIQILLRIIWDTLNALCGVFLSSTLHMNNNPHPPHLRGIVLNVFILHLMPMATLKKVHITISMIHPKAHILNQETVIVWIRTQVS